MCNGIPTPTNSALRTRKSRRKQDTIDSIISSINLFCNDKYRNSLMEVILDSPKLKDTVVAAGYIKNYEEVKMALKIYISVTECWHVQALQLGIPEDTRRNKVVFVNSVLIANTSTPPLDGSKNSIKMIEEVKHLPFSRSASYRRLRYARKPGRY